MRVLRRRAENALGVPNGYDRSVNRRMRAAYDAIVRQDAARAVDRRQHRLISQYAGDVFGSTRYAPSLVTYTAFRGRFFEGWLPQNYGGRYLMPYAQGRYAACGFRTLSAHLLRTDAIPDIAYRIGGIFYDRNFEPVPDGSLLDRIFSETDYVYIKAEGSGKGLGVVGAPRADFLQVAASFRADLSVQRSLKPHSCFAMLSPTAAATLRLITARSPDGSFRLRAAYLRLGRSEDRIVTSARGIRVPVDVTSGALYGYGAMPDWTRADAHPDTGTVFAGRAIPSFHEAKDLVERLHKLAPHIAYCGWDVCITEDEGVKLFEVNVGNAAVSFIEAATGPIFQGLGWDQLHRR
jgi:hypothetical protein